MLEKTEIAEIIEGLEAHCRAPLMTIEARHRWLADWCDDLGQYPLDAVKAAARDYRLSGKTKFPTPGELVPLVRAKVRRNIPESAKPQAWRQPTAGEFDACSLEEKIRHRLIMAGRARGRAGPMFLKSDQRSGGRHLTIDEMPESWHKHIAVARHHETEATELRKHLHKGAASLAGGALE